MNVNLVGATLGDYEIQRELGRGGMGVVYKAVEGKLHRTVALKVLSDKLSQNPAFVADFYREARAAAQISHPNVVTIYSVGEEAELHFIAMEFVQGQTLHHIVKRSGALPTRQAVEIARQVASALGAAHRRKIFHRDIKPHNIMVDGSGQAKVMDFGLAKMKESMAASLGLKGSRPKSMGDDPWAGTPAYMSPEQLQGLPVDQRSDVYSLGVVLYEMLAGRMLYNSTDIEEVRKMALENPLPPLRKANYKVPAYIVRVVEKALAKTRNERYATAEEMETDLKLALTRLDHESSESGKPEEETAPPWGKSDSNRRISVGPPSPTPAGGTAFTTPYPSTPAHPSPVSSGKSSGPGFKFLFRLLLLILAGVLVAATIFVGIYVLQEKQTEKKQDKEVGWIQTTDERG